MAWIESHQDLASHPKTRRLSRLLGVGVPTVIGHLHLLWHWAVDHAEDGDLSAFDADDLADAAGWEGDPAKFHAALVECGPGDRPGFIEDGRLRNWSRYTGGLQARRESARSANHQRWHVQRAVVVDGCRWCESVPPDSPPESPLESVPASTTTPVGLRPDSDRTPNLSATESTKPNQTKNLKPIPSTDVDRGRIDAEFDAFWSAYPARNGRKVGRADALLAWRGLSDAQRQRAQTGARHLAASDQLPKDAVRFLRRTRAGAFPFDDWQEPPGGRRDEPPDEFGTTRGAL